MSAHSASKNHAEADFFASAPSSRRTFPLSPSALWGATLAALFLYALFTRFWLVTVKPLHHDESLFAYYAYFLGRGLGYNYMPILHGPVLQFANAALFVLFGDNQLTARLPAILGGLLLFAVFWFWKPELGRRGLLTAFVLLAVSPSITYYSRFLRNDVPYMMVTVTCALLLIRAFQTRRPSFVWGSILAALLMFSMMESSIFFFAACIGFLGVVSATDLLAGGYLAVKKRRTAGGADSAEGTEGTPEAGGSTSSVQAAPSPETVSAPLPLVWRLIQCALLSGGIVLVLAWFYHRIWSDTVPIHAPLVLLAGRFGWNLQPSGARWIIALAAVPVVFILCLIAAANLRRPHGRQGVLHQFLRTVADNRWPVIGAFATAVALYTLFFTTFFTHLQTFSFDHTEGVRDFKGPMKPLTPVQIYKNTWDYWWDQHKLHRIKGPFHYYLPLLITYELPALLLALWGWARTLLARPGRWINLTLFLLPQFTLGLANVLWLSRAIDWQLADVKFHVTSPVHLHLVLLYVQLLTHVTGLLFARGRRMEAFLTFWTVTSLFAYSYAGEKVPWLTVHVAGPMLLLAGITVRDLAREVRWSRSRLIAASAAIALAVLWQVRTQISVAFVRPASPAERIIYNHTSPDVVFAVEKIRELGHRTNLGRNLPLFIQGEPSWPLYWYLRDMPNAFPPPGETVDETSRPLVIVDWGTAVATPNLRDNYVCQRLKVREWWEPPMLDFGALADLFRVFTPEESRRDGMNALRWLRAKAEWRKLVRYVLFREIWIDPENPDWSNGANEFALCIRKGLDQEYLDPTRLDMMPKRPDIPRSH